MGREGRNQGRLNGKRYEEKSVGRVVKRSGYNVFDGDPAHYGDLAGCMYIIV